MNSDDKTQLALLKKDIEYIKKSLDTIDDKLKVVGQIDVIQEKVNRHDKLIWAIVTAVAVSLVVGLIRIFGGVL